MLFLAGKYAQPAKLNAIARQITNEEIDESDYAFSSDDEVNNWKTTENRDVMYSTLYELELTPFKVHAVPGHMKVAHGKQKLVQVNNEGVNNVGNNTKCSAI